MFIGDFELDFWQKTLLGPQLARPRKLYLDGESSANISNSAGHSIFSGCVGRGQGFGKGCPALARISRTLHFGAARKVCAEVFLANSECDKICVGVVDNLF